VLAALALALAIGAAPPSPAACDLPARAPERPWRTGETLVYDLDVLGMVKAGVLELSVERPMSGGKIVPLRARAKTTEAVASVKRFTAVGLSWIDARTLLPERYRDEAEENGVRKVSDTRIPEEGERISIEYQFGERKGTNTFTRTGEVLDALSALYYLRAARLSPGDRFCFDLVGNRRFWRLEGKVAEKTETVDAPAGKFETLRLDAVARRADLPDAPARPVHLWLSSDARRILVAAVSEVDIGPVRAMLASARGTAR
jgi:hypothetical protein